MHRKRTLHQRLDAIEQMLRSLLRNSNLDLELEFLQMADFKELADKVTLIKGTVNSTKAFIQGLKAKIEELAAGMDDGPDQAAVAALAAELGGAEAELASAIAANPNP